MATTRDFIEYVCEQIEGAGIIRHRKMFGEYMIYINDKPILMVCDNTVFIKIHPCLDNIMKDAAKGFPYQGAKEHYILDIDNSPLCREVINILEKLIPQPLPKKKK